MPRRRRPGAWWRPLGVVGLVVVATAAGVGLAWFVRSVPPAGRSAEQPSRPGVPRRVTQPPARPAPRPAARARPVPGPREAPAPAAPSPQGRLAIVFDDAGGSLEDVEAIIAIGRPVAVAVLPYLAHSTEVARRARAAGLDVLLHLPLEPDDVRKDPGPGVITVSMGDAAIHRAVQAALASVPGAVGINNHMGSRVTADRRAMRAVLRAARDAGMFFLDSYTTPRSVVREVAAEVGVRAASRAIFLDNEDEAAAIAAQVRRAIARARQEGSAIAIGHAQRKTAAVVATMLHEFDEAGVALVPVATLIR